MNCNVEQHGGPARWPLPAAYLAAGPAPASPNTTETVRPISRSSIKTT